MPLYTHDCNCCRFLGSYFNYDVWHHPGDDGGAFPGGSIIARYGNEGYQYASQPIRLLLDSINGDGFIGGTGTDGKSWRMPYRDYLFSDRCCRSTAAMVLAMTVHCGTETFGA